MAKRFTDTEKWKKRWIRNLKQEYKLFWVYILDDCNHAGIWDVDIEIANIKLGTNLSEDDILKAFKDRIIPIDKGNKWFIPKFVLFQYGELNPDNRAHNSVISILNKEGAYKPLVRGLQGRKDMVKDKDKVKDKDNNILFEEIWKKYPGNAGKQKAKEKFIDTVKTEQSWKDINIALDNYKISKRVANGYIQNGSTWFNDWQSWIELSEYEKVEQKPDSKYQPVNKDCKLCNGTGFIYNQSKSGNEICQCRVKK